MPPNSRSREWTRCARISPPPARRRRRGSPRRSPNARRRLPQRLRPVGHQRLAVQLHADVDMLAQRPHRRLEILVVRRLGDREVKGEVRVLAVGLRVGRALHQRQRRRDLLQRLCVPPRRREPRGHRLDADAELVAALDVGDRLDPREAERHGLHLPHVAPGALPRMDEPLFAEPLQRCAQHRPRHPELLGKGRLGRQLPVRRIVPVRDPAVEQVVDPVGQPGLRPRPVAAFRPSGTVASFIFVFPRAGRRLDDRDEGILAAESAGLGDKLQAALAEQHAGDRNAGQDLAFDR